MNCTNTFFNDLVGLLYPEACIGCGAVDVGQHKPLLCAECLAALPETNFYLQRDNPVSKIFFGRITVESATAHTYFTKSSIVQNMLHALKYGGNTEAGMLMGEMIGQKVSGCGWLSDLGALIPLPLHIKKQKKRGYNQAAVICGGINQVTGVPVLENIVKRTKRTETQTRKSRLERWSNIEGKFELINGEAIENKHVLLVDDVITTGATLEACGRELLKVRGLRLSIASFAYTSL